MKDTIYDDRLVIKVVGSRNRISEFLKQLRKNYNSRSINISPMIQNRGEQSFRCFVNLFYDLDSCSAK